jgi:hypothetical protein
MMNGKLKLIYALLIGALILQGCKDDEPEIGEPFDKTEGLTATAWVISEVYLVDEGNPAKPEREISSFYTESGNLLEIRFDADGTFETIPGDGVNFFPESGNWSFNNPNTPSSITFTSGDVVFESPLGGPTRISDSELRLNVPRFCFIDGEDKAVLGYRMVFVRKS